MAAQGGSALNEVRYSVVEQGANSGVKNQDYTVLRTQSSLDTFATTITTAVLRPEPPSASMIVTVTVKLPLSK